MAKGRRDRYWLGFDLGGSKSLAVIFDPQMRPVARARKRTRGQEGAEEGVRHIRSIIDAALNEAGIAARALGGIGIGCAGPVDMDRGTVLEMPNLGWKKVKLAKAITAAYDCPVVLVNDADAGVYGEYRFGAAAGARCLVGLFAGTGIGGGAIYEGEIIRGGRGSCFEIGHLPVVHDGPPCGCGRRGCLEAVAGRLAISTLAAAAAYRGQAPNLLRLAGTDLREIRSRALADAIAAGDRTIEAIVRSAAREIGWALAGVVNLMAPDVIVLGGGMVEDMPELFCNEIDQAARARVMPSFARSFEVVAAKLAGEASALGAAAWAQHVIGEDPA